MKGIINFFIFIILGFVVYSGYQIFFEGKELKDVGKIFSRQVEELKGAGAEKAVDLWLKENINGIQYRELHCFDDEEFGLSCTMNKFKGKGIYGQSLTIYGIADVGLNGFDVKSYLNTAFNIKANGLRLSDSFISDMLRNKVFEIETEGNSLHLSDGVISVMLRDPTYRDIFSKILKDADQLTFELKNEEPSTGTIEFKSHIAFNVISSKENRYISMILDSFGKKYIVENCESLSQFIDNIPRLNLDKLYVDIQEGDSMYLNRELYKLFVPNKSLIEYISDSGDEITAYYQLMSQVARETHRKLAKHITQFIMMKNNRLRFKIESESFDGIEIGDIFKNKLSDNQDIELK